MTREPDPYERLLESLTDDTPDDWEGIRRALGASGRARVDALEELSRIAAFHRGLQRGADPAAAPPGAWGGFQLLERLASGARAEVWRAWEPALRREVALKLMRTDALGSGTAEAALLDEARAAARVTHPHVVAVHGVARHGEHVGMWMELVRGPSLEGVVRDAGPLGPRAVAQLGAELAAALAALHAGGVLHRDIKPANVLRDPSGRWMLADFGLGLSRDRRATPAPVSAGTPMYLAPEQFLGQPPSPATDQYALGLTLAFALIGRDAFDARTLEERAAQAERPSAPSLRAALATADASLAALVERSLARDPGARFPSAAAFEAALRGWVQRGGRVRGPRAAGWAAALAALGTVALVLVLRERPRPPVEPPPPPAARTAPAAGYEVAATLVRRGAGGREALANGARVRPGDRLSLDVSVSRPAWVYVLNEDERGERYLLFPQPRFDQDNPLPADSVVALPGTVGGRENAWTVTSRGGREHFLIVVSPEPVAELESELARLPAPRPDRPIEYASVSMGTVERLRGVGGVAELPARDAVQSPAAGAFERFRALAGREAGVRGVWVRQVVLENPLR